MAEHFLIGDFDFHYVQPAATLVHVTALIWLGVAIPLLRRTPAEEPLPEPVPEEELVEAQSPNPPELPSACLRTPPNGSLPKHWIRCWPRRRRTGRWSSSTTRRRMQSFEIAQKSRPTIRGSPLSATRRTSAPLPAGHWPSLRLPRHS